MSDRTDPAWDEYLSTGEDPTGGELEEADEEIISDEVVPGQWQQYSSQADNKPHVRNTFTKVGFEQFFDALELLVVIIFLLACVGTCS